MVTYTLSNHRHTNQERSALVFNYPCLAQWSVFNLYWMNDRSSLGEYFSKILNLTGKTERTHSPDQSSRVFTSIQRQPSVDRDSAFNWFPGWGTQMFSLYSLGVYGKKILFYIHLVGLPRCHGHLKQIVQPEHSHWWPLFLMSAGSSAPKGKWRGPLSPILWCLTASLLSCRWEGADWYGISDRAPHGEDGVSNCKRATSKGRGQTACSNTRG